MGSVSFTPDAQDLVAAYRTSFTLSLRSWRIIRTWLIGGVFFALVTQVFAWSQGLLAKALWALGGVAYWTLLLAIILGINYLLLPRRVRRVYAQQKALHDPVSVDWSPEDVAITSSRGAARFAWTDFHRIAQGRHTILLSQSDALFNFIPHRVLTPAQAAELMAFARARRGDG